MSSNAAESVEIADPCGLPGPGSVTKAGVELQHRVRQSILDADPDAADTLLLLEHPPTYTVGRNCDRGDVLAAPEWLEQRGNRCRPVRPGAGAPRTTVRVNSWDTRWST